MMFTYFIVACVLFCAPVFCNAAELPSEVEAAVASAPSAESFPQASLLVLWDRRALDIDSGGAATIFVDQCLKLLDDRAKDDQGDRSIRFDDRRDTVIFEQAWTRQADGTWIEPEKDAFTVTSAPEVQWASAYSQLKQQNVSFPGLAAGAVIYWKYKIAPKEGREPWADDFFGGIVSFGGFEPVQEQSFEIVSDESVKIQFEMQNSHAAPTDALHSGRKSLRWEFRNLAQLVPEPDMVPSSQLVPRLVYTSFADWSDCGLYVGDRFLDAVVVADKAIDEFAKTSFVAGSGKSAAQNIAYWVQKNIRTVPLGFGAVGYEPNTADDVWANRYGDVRDKLVLLSALLGAKGLNSYPVMMQASSSPFSQLPVLEQFNHMILAVPLEDDTLFLDPTPRFSPPDEIAYSRTQGMACQLVPGAPILSKSSELVRVDRHALTTMSVRLDEAGTLSGRADCEAVGDYATGARHIFSDQKEQERSIYFQRAASRIGQGAVIRNTEVSDPEQLTQPMRVSLEFECKDYAVHQEDLLLVELPVTPFSFAVSGFYPTLPEVIYPVDLPIEGSTDTRVVMSYPPGYRVAYLPTPLIIDNLYLSLSLTPKQLEDRVEWTQSLRYKQDSVPVSDYETLRKAFEGLVDSKNRLLVLEKK
ncbi:MAG: DUF3857 domain-containing protein [Calditrichaeota bacterium]|nr:DUF3857 domain-containing protein [Calditrichota bacterium]